MAASQPITQSEISTVLVRFNATLQPGRSSVGMSLVMSSAEFFFPVSRTRSVAKESLLKSIVVDKFGQSYQFFDLIVDEAYFDTPPS